MSNLFVQAGWSSLSWGHPPECGEALQFPSR
jgi:hypothetical protein